MPPLTPPLVGGGGEGVQVGPFGAGTDTSLPIKREQSKDGLCLVSQFTQELFMTKGQKDMFSSTQTQEGDGVMMLGDRFVNMSLLYLFRKATDEVKEFNSSAVVQKVAVEVDGVLLSAGRIINEMEFMQTGEIEVDLGSLGIRTRLPILDRHSPLAYSIAQYVHWDLAKHRGAETCSRISLEHVSIMQGAALYRELGQNCPRCAIKRKRYIEAAFGPIKENQLAIAPPFWFCQMDLFGPVDVFVPGFERETRNRRVLKSKCWIMVSVCPTTKLVNIQVVEQSSAAGIVSGVIRLGCEVGLPAKMFIDQDRASMCGLSNAEYDVRNLQLTLERKYGMEFEVCPVQGHNMHGMVERIIRSLQESFTDSGLLAGRYHATGLQTLAKLVENQYNNLPLGYHFGKDQDNGPLLKMVCPNHLRVGRMNKRSLDGPVRLPRGKMEMLENVDKMYSAWFRLWKEVFVPKLMFQPKWFKTDRDLVEGDLVFFIKKDGDLESKWTMGMVESLEKGRDGVIRRATIKYCNSGEQNLSMDKTNTQDSTFPRYTERTVRRLVKVFSLEETSLAEDLAELDRRELLHKRKQASGVDLVVDAIRDNSGDIDDLTNECDLQVSAGEGRQGVQQPGGDAKDQLTGPAANTRSKRACNVCCCDVHCGYTVHTKAKAVFKEFPMAMVSEDMNIDVLHDLEETQLVTQVGGLAGMLGSVGVDLSALFE